jgi:hypothetical protein
VYSQRSPFILVEEMPRIEGIEQVLGRDDDACDHVSFSAGTPHRGDSADPASSPSPQATAAVQHIKIGSVTVSGSLRTRMESWDWF